MILFCFTRLTGAVLISDLSRAGDDQSYLWHPPLLLLDPHHAHHVSCKLFFYSSVFFYCFDIICCGLVISSENLISTTCIVTQHVCLHEQIRIFTNTFTLTPHNGAGALVCLSETNLNSSDMYYLHINI